MLAEGLVNRADTLGAWEHPAAPSLREFPICTYTQACAARRLRLLVGATRLAVVDGRSSPSTWASATCDRHARSRDSSTQMCCTPPRYSPELAVHAHATYAHTPVPVQLRSGSSAPVQPRSPRRLRLQRGRSTSSRWIRGLVWRRDTDRSWQSTLMLPTRPPRTSKGRARAGCYQPAPAISQIRVCWPIAGRARSRLDQDHSLDLPFPRRLRRFSAATNS
jgi:hypothetical protein